MLYEKYLKDSLMEIGEGSFGKVYSIKRKLDGKKFAMKLMKFNNVQD